MFQRLTANLMGAQTRREKLNGKEYLVVPTVMLAEGVWTGNQGPLFYAKDQLSKNPLGWNHKPIVFYHPVGGADTACSPDVIERQGCGLMLNSSWDGRLKTESWLDEPKLRSLDKENIVLNAINSGLNVEVSTGLFHDLDPTPGQWNGCTYNGAVVNIQPDHLALLPDQTGAFSIKDGGGLLRNASGSDLAYDDVREQLRARLKDKLGTDSGMMHYFYIVDVFRTYFVYDYMDKTYKLGYSIKDNKVKLSNDEPEVVAKVTSYVSANAVLLGGTNNMEINLPYRNPGDKIVTIDSPALSQTTEENPMAGTTTTQANPPAQNTVHQGTEQITKEALTPPPQVADEPAKRKSLVDIMIGAGVATEADRTDLLNMSATDFQGVHNWAMKKAKPVQQPTYLPLPVTNVQGDPVQDWLTKTGCPPVIANQIKNSLARDEEEKVALVQKITSNAKNRFNPEWLKAQDVVMLRGIASLADGQQQQTNQPAVNNYSGAADVPVLLPLQNSGQPQNNGSHAQIALPLPHIMTDAG